MRRAPWLVAGLIASGALAAEPLRSFANPDPLRAASLPLDLAPAVPLADGEWRIEAALSYANLWQGTWETAAIHRELGRDRLPIAGFELRELERRYPEREMYRIDLEGWRTDLVVQRGLAHGLVLSVQLPYLDVGRPHWDGIGEWWHETLSLPSADRDLFPRGAALLYVRSHEGTQELRDELIASGIGDLTLSLAAPLGAFAGAAHRAVLSVDAPTGDEGTLLGSGGWDVGARWFATWTWRSRSLVAGAGYTRLDRSGSLLGIERTDTWHMVVSFDQRLGARWSATASFSYESSALADLTGTALGDAAAFLRLGIARELGDGVTVALDTGQDWYGTGLSPDYAFRLALGYRPRRR